MLCGCKAKIRRGNMKKIRVEGSETKGSVYEPNCRRCDVRLRSPVYSQMWSYSLQVACNSPGPGQRHSKTGCLKLPRLGTSSPGAPRPRVQPALSPEERITDLARETLCCSRLNKPPLTFSGPIPNLTISTYRNILPGAFPEERALFLLAWLCLHRGTESAPSARLV